MKILELLGRKTKELIETSEELGDGRAEILGEGTYSDYENDQKEEQTWLEWAKEQLKR